MKYFDYPDAAELNPIIYEMASNDIKLSEPVTHLQARTTPNIKSIRVDGGGILTNLNIHQRNIEEVNKFFNWIEEQLDIKVDMSWIAMYNQHQSGGKHCHMEYDMTFCYYANVPIGSSSLMVEGTEVEPVLGRVVAFSGQLEHEVLLSEVDGRCSLVGHGS